MRPDPEQISRLKAARERHRMMSEVLDPYMSQQLLKAIDAVLSEFRIDTDEEPTAVTIN